MLLEFTASETVAVQVFSKLILSFLTVVLTDEQICSPVYHCNGDEKAVATTNLSSHTYGLILDSEELSTLTKHLKLCCFYPNVAVNCFSPNAFLRALCNLTNTSIVCCSCAKPLLLQNINTFCDSEIIPHMERALKTFLNFGARNIRTAAIDLLWNFVEIELLETETAEYIIRRTFSHESKELAKCILGRTKEVSPEGKYLYHIVPCKHPYFDSSVISEVLRVTYFPPCKIFAG